MKTRNRVMLIASLALWAWSAQASTITLSSSAVAVQAGNSVCSLREAIQNVNANADLSGGDCVAVGGGAIDTIVLAPVTYTISDALTSDVGAVGLPRLQRQITIQGSGAVIQRDPSFTGVSPCGAGTRFRILAVAPGISAVLSTLTIQNGCASNSDFGLNVGGAAWVGAGASLTLQNAILTANQARVGGAIFNLGTTIIQSSTLSGNQAEDSAGAVHNDSVLTISDSTLATNVVTEGMGGALVNTKTMNIVRSVLNGNQAIAEAGGAVYNGLATVEANVAATTSTITNSTISGNLAGVSGGGIQVTGKVNLNNATITDNDASSGEGGGLYVKTSSPTVAAGVDIRNSIIAAQDGSNDCAGTTANITSLTHNLDSDGTCISNGMNNDVTVADPLLLPLGAHGGPTMTHPLDSGSLALDAGTCAEAVDQRSVNRPMSQCDIGAYEAVCGDNDTAGEEECDDANASDADACLSDCTNAACGDTVLCTDGSCTTGPSGGVEVCDDGNSLESDACLNDCSAASCGDGQHCTAPSCTSGPLGGAEECDDGNTQDDDVCLSTCQLPGGDTDGDGVANAIEEGGPNMGDGNGDGTADSLQESVTTVDSPSMGKITMVVGGSCSKVEQVAVFQEGVNPLPLDPEFAYPLGLIGFELPCEEADIVLYYHEVASFPSGTVYRKYGPQAPNFNGAPSFYTLPGVVFGSATVNNTMVATASFTLKDAELGDDTGDDGRIVDQGGPGNLATRVAPAVSWLGLAMLALVLVTAAWSTLRRVAG